MKRTIVLAEPRGFCAGVERALQSVEKALTEGPYPVYVLHEIVHNEAVVEDLRRRGVRFIEDPAEAVQGTLIFSAHGVGRVVEAAAATQPVRIIDATCPIVKTLHRRIEGYAATGRTILLFGRKGHREVEGLLGRVDSPVMVIESELMLDEFLRTADRTKAYACLSQTTLNAEEVERMRMRLKKELPDVVLSAEVCCATRDRQNAVRELAKRCEVILVVGSERSSNTRRLKETAESCGIPAYLVTDAAAFDLGCLKNHTRIGITSGASAPERLVLELRDRIVLKTKED